MKDVCAMLGTAAILMTANPVFENYLKPLHLSDTDLQLVWTELSTVLVEHPAIFLSIMGTRSKPSQHRKSFLCHLLVFHYASASSVPGMLCMMGNVLAIVNVIVDNSWFLLPCHLDAMPFGCHSMHSSGAVAV